MNNQDKRHERLQVIASNSVYRPLRMDETTAAALDALAAERFNGNRSAAIRASVRAYTAVKASEEVGRVK